VKDVEQTHSSLVQYRVFCKCRKGCHHENIEFCAGDMVRS
jgi:hypothetical protein